jgi:hypothetical protein
MLKKVKIANNKVTHSEEWGVFLRTAGFFLMTEAQLL